MKILVACEYSGTVREAFAKLGHDSWSCDLLPSDIPSDKHYQGDVKDILYDGSWDLLIAHPPCTRLCNSGVRWLHERQLWKEMEEGAAFFKLFLNAPVPKIAVENPIPHMYAKKFIGNYSQIIQPWQFGHGETKATCLWLKGLSLLKPTNIVSGREQRLHLLPPSADRWKLRSTTFAGIARAMAEQWGGDLHGDFPGLDKTFLTMTINQ